MALRRGDPLNCHSRQKCTTTMFIYFMGIFSETQVGLNHFCGVSCYNIKKQAKKQMVKYQVLKDNLQCHRLPRGNILTGSMDLLAHSSNNVCSTSSMTVAARIPARAERGPQRVEGMWQHRTEQASPCCFWIVFLRGPFCCHTLN